MIYKANNCLTIKYIEKSEKLSNTMQFKFTFNHINFFKSFNAGLKSLPFFRKKILPNLINNNITPLRFRSLPDCII